jgi:hypothetical protein
MSEHEVLKKINALKSYEVVCVECDEKFRDLHRKPGTARAASGLRAVDWRGLH